MGAKKVQEVYINVDTPLEKIIEYDEQGAVLRFRIEPGEFPEIPEDYLLRLTKKNKDSYLVSRDLHADRMENATDEERYEDIIVGENMGNARQRLAIEGLPKNLQHRWVRPDRVEAYKRRGWTVYEGKEVTTLDKKQKNGVRTLSNMGVKEHYLMVISEEKRKRNQDQKREKRESRFQSAENRAREEFGENVVDDKTHPAAKLTPAVGSEDE